MMWFVGFSATLKCWDLGRQRSLGISQQNQLKVLWHSCKIEIQLWKCWRAGKLRLLLWAGHDFLPVSSCFPLKPFLKFQQRGVLCYLLMEGSSGRDAESLPRKETKQDSWVLWPLLCRGRLQAFLVPSHRLPYAARLDESQVFLSFFLHVLSIPWNDISQLFCHCVNPCTCSSPLGVALTSSTQCSRAKITALTPLADRERAVCGLEQGKAAS